MRDLSSLLRRFRDDERGVFAVFFGLFAIVLIAMAGCVVDYTNLELARAKAQQALDAAALGLAPMIYDADANEADMKAQAQDLVTERVADSNVAIQVTNADIDKPNGRLQLSGSITVPMAFVQLVGIPRITATLVSEATKGSINLEVAVALDNTGSMEDYIDDLKEGLNGLIDIVVKDDQEPTYSKMAIAPYAAALDAGEYADTVRGTVPAAKTASSINWSTSPVNITGATQANPIKITTSTKHGYANGDIVYITGVKGMTALNGNFYKVAGKTDTTFNLQTNTSSPSNIDGTSGTCTKYNRNGTCSTFVYNYAAYTSSGTTRACLVTSCELVVTSASHGLTTNKVIRLTDTGNSKLADATWTITNRTTNTFSLNGTPTYSDLLTYPVSSKGNIWCTDYGCKYYYFKKSTSKNSTYSTYKMTDSCVTERMTNSYSDVPPSTTKLSPNYTSNGVCDLDEPIVPLTSDRDILHDAADRMDDHGSTAGHLGTAWGWYLVAPDWGYVWNDPNAVPAAYDADNLLKVVILMTDGAYNIQYCNGVSDANIYCDAPSDATTQARTLCTEMKKDNKVVVYTVGFNIKANSSEAKTMTDCASDDTKAFLPTDGAALVADFLTIGQNISDLRLSR